MRILHFIPSLQTGVGGPARAVIDLAEALVARGHRVTVATSHASQPPSSWLDASREAPRAVVLPPPLPGCVFLGEALRKIRALVESHDVVHVHGVWEFANIQICSFAAKLAKPYIVSIHGMLGHWSLAQNTFKKNIYLQLFGKKWLRGASRIHLTAESELDAAARFFPRELGRVLPLLIDLRDFRDPPGAQLAEARLRGSAGKPRVLFLSRLHPVKSLETLLQAARLLRQRGRDISIVIAGDGDPGYVTQLKSIARDLADSVSFLGMVTGDLKLSLYRACDVFALPTHHENFGVVFIEALACGLPVITTPAVALAAELQSSGAVTLVDRTPEQFAAAIDEVLADSAREAIGRRGRDWVFRSFDTTTSVRRFESLYADVLGAPRRIVTADAVPT